MGSRVPVPLAAEIYFCSGCTQPYLKKIEYVKLSVPGNPLKISLSAIEDLINWVIPGKTIKKNGV